MSIELLPPDPVYPAGYHVRPNYCRCHPETCCCSNYAVHDKAGAKVTTDDDRSHLETVAKHLNEHPESIKLYKTLR